jgi:hypothetical protein
LLLRVRGSAWSISTLSTVLQWMQLWLMQRALLEPSRCRRWFPRSRADPLAAFRTFALDCHVAPCQLLSSTIKADVPVQRWQAPGAAIGSGVASAFCRAPRSTASCRKIVYVIPTTTLMASTPTPAGWPKAQVDARAAGAAVVLVGQTASQSCAQQRRALKYPGD